MFSSAWIWETYFKEAWINIVVASELLKPRADFYKYMHPKTKVIVWDIRDEKLKKEYIDSIDNDVKFLVATPPCQWISNLWKNKNIDEKLKDPRNYLVFDVLDVIDKKDFDYVIFENVPWFLTIKLPYEWDFYTIVEILEKKYWDKYNVEWKVLNAKDYWVPQSRPRAIVKMYKTWLKWWWPKEQKEITLKEAIGHLPSLESWEKSDLKYHYARNHDPKHVLRMKHTPTGQTALDNDKYYPVKKDWTRVKGFKATYKRMSWDKPASAITMRNDAISSQDNVHPWRLLPDWTYSDARVLTLRELFIVSSLPEERDIPEWASDTFMRQIIWEWVPPKLFYNIIKQINKW